MNKFKKTEWNSRPEEVEKLKSGKVRVNRKVVEKTREDGTVYFEGESAVMDAGAYAAYEGAMMIDNEAGLVVEIQKATKKDTKNVEKLKKDIQKYADKAETEAFRTVCLKLLEILEG